ncbi:hypothetical protein PENTCL1PPCAC_21110, partial [Pristionchus entomophagus]
FASGAESTDCTTIGCNILVIFPIEMSNEMIDQGIGEILASQTIVSCDSFHLDNALLLGDNGYIECSSAEIKDQRCTLSVAFLIEAVCQA